MKRIEVDIAVVVRAGEVLICRRPEGGSFAGLWEFPGGKREAGESPHQCLRRELAEEVGIVADPVEALTAIEHDYPTARIRLNPFLCTHREGEPRPLASQELLWVAPPSLRRYPFPPANEPLIEEVINRLNRPGRHGVRPAPP